MQSRMKKIYGNEEEKNKKTQNSRSNKNKKLYKEVGNLEIENFDTNSNASVIGVSSNEIDIDKIKDMLDKKYKETPKKKSIGDTTEINLPKINLDETREYDINSILKKAKEEKEVDYEKDRLKKLKNSQYDILKDINIEEIEDDDEEILERKKTKNKENKLKELIEESNKNEIEDSADLALDILSDLKGEDEDTKVMGAMDLEDEIDTVEEDTKLSKTLKITDDNDFLDDDEKELEEIEPESDEDKSQSISIDELLEDDLEKEKEFITDKIFKKDRKIEDIIDDEDEHTKTELLLVDDSLEETKEEKYFTKTEDLFNAAAIRKNSKKSLIENSFVGETPFTETDFDDFDDLKDESSFGKVIIRILIAIIIIAVIFGIIYFISEYFGFNWF